MSYFQESNGLNPGLSKPDAPITETIQAEVQKRLPGAKVEVIDHGPTDSLRVRASVPAYHLGGDMGREVIVNPSYGTQFLMNFVAAVQDRAIREFGLLERANEREEKARIDAVLTERRRVMAELDNRIELERGPHASLIRRAALEDFRRWMRETQ